MNVSLLPPLAREAVVKFLINQNITLSADGVFSREGLCNESLAVNIGEIVCGSQCPGEFYR